MVYTYEEFLNFSLDFHDSGIFEIYRSTILLKILQSKILYFS